MKTILFIGDIVGRPGRRAVREIIPRLKSTRRIDFIVANVENAAGGSGITPSTAQEIFGAGVDILTSGDHVWRNKEVFSFIGTESRFLRPANYPPGSPGQGSGVVNNGGGVSLGVINLLGRVFMKPIDCPFRAVEEELERLRMRATLLLVDFHAEATSEKIAMGRCLEGRVTAVVGTHTHVQTADSHILRRGTAYITDVGMTGPCDSVIGRDTEAVLRHFRTQLPQRFEVAKEGIEFQAVLITADEKTGRAVAIERIKEKLN